MEICRDRRSGSQQQHLLLYRYYTFVYLPGLGGRAVLFLGEPMNDIIKSPEHYTAGGIETIDYIRAKLGPEGFRAYCLGNVLKYISRYDKKGKPEEDLKKAQVYLGWAIEAGQPQEGSPAKYRKLPVTIEAYQTDKEIDIPTLEGVMHASVGDYIITGVRGEQYPCKPEIFRQTYEPAE